MISSAINFVSAPALLPRHGHALPAQQIEETVAQSDRGELSRSGGLTGL